MRTIAFTIALCLAAAVASAQNTWTTVVGPSTPITLYAQQWVTISPWTLGYMGNGNGLYFDPARPECIFPYRDGLFDISTRVIFNGVTTQPDGAIVLQLHQEGPGDTMMASWYQALRPFAPVNATLKANRVFASGRDCIYVKVISTVTFESTLYAKVLSGRLH